MPWQQLVADVGLELNPDGSLVYSEVDLEVGRQEGKTELKFVIAVMRLTAMVATHGPQRVTYTMQDRKKARTRLERDYAPRLRDAAGFREIDPKSRQRPTKRTEWRLGMNSGVEHIQFGPSSWLQIDTPSRTGGHGDTLDLGMIDEAFAHQDDTVEQGMEPAMLTREDPQLWVLSAGGDAKSSYLWRKILRGRQMVEQGADSVVAYFEWSAEEDADPGEPATWARCCPALGYTVTEAKLEALWRKALEGGQEAIDAFRRAYLSQWPEVPVLTEDTSHRVIPAGLWNDAADTSSIANGTMAHALDVDTNARGEVWASIAESDGSHVELVTPPETGPGLAWVVPACKERRQAFREILVDGSGPAAALIPELEAAKVKVRKVTPAEMAQASAQMLEATVGRRLRHIDQPQLNAAAAGADRRDVGDGLWRWSRKRSTVDIAPLIACSLARWGAASTKKRGRSAGF